MQKGIGADDMKKSAILLTIMTILTLIIGGCTKDDNGEWAPFKKDEQASLKIMYWDEKSFYEDYGMMFQSEFPNVAFEIISLPSNTDPPLPVYELYNRYIEQNQPDILMVTPNHRWLAEEGMLLELDTLIERDKFDLDSYLSTVVSMLRKEGDGKLYGLAPSFSSYGIYYNLDLFQKHGIDLPRDSMTWEEIFELAARFPAEGDGSDSIYGFTIDEFSSPLEDILLSWLAQNKKMLNQDGSGVQLDSESWRTTFESLVSAVQSGALYHPSPEELAQKFRDRKEHRFLNGTAAMTYNSEHLIPALNRSEINWGVASAPVDPLNRTQSSAYSLGPTFVIVKQSSNARAAWEFVKYVNSASFAQIKSKASGDILFSRSEFIRPQGERDISALYRLEAIADLTNEFDSFDGALRLKMVRIIVNELVDVIDRVKTLDEAIEKMQEEGTAMLFQARSAAAAP
ncbi:extracellular solute-binding protein [Paenibacillaceae bacterium]|nr:extracellular solute-binding protein [Paenibacillaceae bacterium]